MRRSNQRPPRLLSHTSSSANLSCRRPLPALRLQNSASNPEPRLLFPLCPLYLQRIVNTVDANMVLQDRKQLWAEVKHPGCCLRDWQLVRGILRRPPPPAVIASDGSAFALLKGRQSENRHMWNMIFGMWGFMFFRGRRGGVKMNLFLCCCSADPRPCGLSGFTKSPSLYINTQFPLSVQEMTTSGIYQIVHIHCPALKSLVLGPFFKMHSHLQARNNCAFPIFTPPLLFFVTHVNKRCRTRSRDWWLSLKQ